MRKSAIADFRHPATGEPLVLTIDEENSGEVITGSLVSTSGDRFRIVRGVPRFCPEVNYSASFGYQWQTYSDTQLDSQANWGAESERRIRQDTGWSQRMEGQCILEAGSGCGRFTEILLRSGAHICTFDYSTAVDANVANNGHHENVSFAQASIYEMPYEQASFDKILCIGVLQHCPSPRKAFLCLSQFLKPGGEIVVDIYRLDFRCLFLGKYYLRPVTKRLPLAALRRFVRFQVGWIYPFTGWLQRLIGPRGRSVSWMLGMADYRGVYDMEEAKARELSELDTFDALAPAYDRPATMAMVRRWFAEAGLVNIEVRTGGTGILAKGKKPELVQQ